MTIRQQYQPDLTDPRIFQFLQDDTQPHWAPADPTKLGYSASRAPNKPAGSIINSTPGVNFALFWAVREYYEVTEGIRPHPVHVIGSFDVVVPMEQPTKVNIFSVLLIQNGTPPDLIQKIEAAFTQYDYKGDGDAAEYARTKMVGEPRVTNQTFLVECTFSLDKTTKAPIHHTDELDAMLAMYEYRSNGTVWPAPGAPGISLGENGYFAKREFRAKKLRSQPLESVPAKRSDPVHEVENPAKGPDDVIKDIEESEGAAAECDRHFKDVHWKLMHLVDYPELRTVWKTLVYGGDCFEIRIPYPQLQHRMSKLFLYAYARYPDPIDATIEDIIKQCATDSAVAGAVIGVVVADFDAGLQAFRGIFTECIKDHLNRAIDCMIPGLALIKEVTDDWH
jgi:hypothetical protein